MSIKQGDVYFDGPLTGQSEVSCEATEAGKTARGLPGLCVWAPLEQQCPAAAAPEDPGTRERIPLISDWLMKQVKGQRGQLWRGFIKS